MLSRIADSLFWLNRYMERNDCLLRTVRTNYILSFDTDQQTDFSWKDVVRLFSADPEAAALHGNDISSSVKYLIADIKNLNSSKVLVTKAREMQEVYRIILPKKFGSRSINYTISSIMPVLRKRLQAL